LRKSANLRFCYVQDFFLEYYRVIAGIGESKPFSGLGFAMAFMVLEVSFMQVEKEESKDRSSSRVEHNDITEQLLDQAIKLLDESSKNPNQPEHSHKLPPSLDQNCINNIEKHGRSSSSGKDERDGVFTCSSRDTGRGSTPGETFTCSDREPGKGNGPAEIVTCSSKETFKPGDWHKPGEINACSAKIEPGEWNKPGGINACSAKIEPGEWNKPGGINACSAKIPGEWIKPGEHQKPGDVFACSSEFKPGEHHKPGEVFACSSEFKPGQHQKPGEVFACSSEFKPREHQKPGNRYEDIFACASIIKPIDKKLQ
jgi:hypothetical protein